MMDLCLVSNQWLLCDIRGRSLQLFGLPRRQDLAHGDCGIRYMKLGGYLFATLSQGMRPAADA
jgi:hypothetical protein